MLRSSCDLLGRRPLGIVAGEVERAEVAEDVAQDATDLDQHVGVDGEEVVVGELDQLIRVERPPGRRT